MPVLSGSAPIEFGEPALATKDDHGHVAEAAR